MEYLTGGEEKPKDSVLRETSQLDVTDVQGAKKQVPTLTCIAIVKGAIALPGMANTQSGSWNQPVLCIL